MTPNPEFLNQPPEFWANVRLISQKLGYTDRKTKQIKVPSITAITTSYTEEKLSPDNIATGSIPTPFGQQLIDYFTYRAEFLNERVEPLLMNAREAKALFDRLNVELKPACPLPLNKQKGEKKGPAYFTGLINMLIEAHSENYTVNYDPRLLTSFTQEGLPVRTLSRRVDGAFPDTVNPLAIWEIKEYYYTTTFGSRVADGVYETLLDGLELREAKENLGLNVNHYLFIDDHFTWWDCGRSYLCRICDMMHMGLVTEVVFGREAVDRVPALTAEWVERAKLMGLQPKRKLH